MKSPYDPLETKRLLTNCIYLEDQLTDVLGFSIYGSPWQPEFFGWAFNLPRDRSLLDKWRLIPEKVDILITHGPPLGRGDLCAAGNRAGCHYLLQEIQERIKPRFHIFGHIHEDPGASSDGTTTFINASTCTYNYKPSQPVLVFDICKP